MGACRPQCSLLSYNQDPNSGNDAAHSGQDLSSFSAIKTAPPIDMSLGQPLIEALLLSVSKLCQIHNEN